MERWLLLHLPAAPVPQTPQVTNDFFNTFMPAGFKPKDVYVAGTVDQGGNVANAITALGIPLVLCNAHRLNTALSWGLGISGSARTCKNTPFRNLLGKMAALVGVFSHAAGNNDLLSLVQTNEIHSIQSELEEIRASAATMEDYFGAERTGEDQQRSIRRVAEAAARAAVDAAARAAEAAGEGGEGLADDVLQRITTAAEEAARAATAREAQNPEPDATGIDSGAASAGAAAAAEESDAVRLRALNLLSRNDTRWLGNKNMMDRLVKLYKPVRDFFQLKEVRG
jgi:hypothetical protein